MQKRARPGALAGATGAAYIFGKLAGPHEDNAIHPASQHIAIRMLRQRFGFTPATARAICELAGLGPAVGAA